MTTGNMRQTRTIRNHRRNGEDPRAVGLHELARVLNEALARRDWPAARLAHEAGVDVRTVQSWTNPSKDRLTIRRWDYLPKIAAVLQPEVTLGQLREAAARSAAEPLVGPTPAGTTLDVSGLRPEVVESLRRHVEVLREDERQP